MDVLTGGKKGKGRTLSGRFRFNRGHNQEAGQPITDQKGKNRFSVEERQNAHRPSESSNALGPRKSQDQALLYQRTCGSLS